MKLFPDEVKKKYNQDNSLSPEKVMDRLVYFHEQAHFNHWQTRVFSRHKALDKFQKETYDWKDKIAELLLGYIAPNRFERPPQFKLTNISDDQLLDEFIDFSRSLDKYGRDNNWLELSNYAADLEGLGEKIKYLLTLQ